MRTAYGCFLALLTIIAFPLFGCITIGYVQDFVLKEAGGMDQGGKGLAFAFLLGSFALFAITIGLWCHFIATDKMD